MRSRREVHRKIGCGGLQGPHAGRKNERVIEGAIEVTLVAGSGRETHYHSGPSGLLSWCLLSLGRGVDASWLPCGVVDLDVERFRRVYAGRIQALVLSTALCLVNWKEAGAERNLIRPYGSYPYPIRFGTEGRIS